MITTWILTLLTFLVGYYFGSHKNIPLHEQVQSVTKSIKQSIKPSVPSRAEIIQRPTAKQIERFHEDDKTKAAKEALSETFLRVKESNG